MEEERLISPELENSNEERLENSLRPKKRLCNSTWKWRCR